MLDKEIKVLANLAKGKVKAEIGGTVGRSRYLSRAELKRAAFSDGLFLLHDAKLALQNAQMVFDIKAKQPNEEYNKDEIEYSNLALKEIDKNIYAIEKLLSKW